MLLLLEGEKINFPDQDIPEIGSCHQIPLRVHGDGLELLVPRARSVLVWSQREEKLFLLLAVVL